MMIQGAYSAMIIINRRLIIHCNKTENWILRPFNLSVQIFSKEKNEKALFHVYLNHFVDLLKFALYCLLFHNQWAWHKGCHNLRQSCGQIRLVERVSSGRDSRIRLTAQLSVTSLPGASRQGLFSVLFLLCTSGMDLESVKLPQKETNKVTFKKHQPKRHTENARHTSTSSKRTTRLSDIFALLPSSSHLFWTKKPTCGTTP